MSTVGDPAGRGALTFTYDASGTRLPSVSDLTGRAVTFGYDGSTPSRLHAVMDRENATTTCAYAGAAVGITSAMDARQVTVLSNH